jgi:putative FmdB family regulatory protein
MPEYAYKCEACGKSFSKIMGIKEHETAKVTCPKCASKKVTQKVTSFSPITPKKS